MSDETQKEVPWVCPGYTEEHEDELIGNREGFQLLRKKIDEVLETGGTSVQTGGIEWVGLKLVAEDPRRKRPVSRGPRCAESRGRFCNRGRHWLCFHRRHHEHLLVAQMRKADPVGTDNVGASRRRV